MFFTQKSNTVSKTRATLGLLMVVILALLTGAFLYRTDFLAILPSPASSIAVNTYSEPGPDSSVATFRKTKDHLEFQYTLSKSFSEPFAAIYLWDTLAENTFDASSYDILEIHLRSQKGKRIPIWLKLNKTFISAKDTVDKIPYTLLVDHFGNDTTYKLRLKDFKVPSWWLRNYKLSEKHMETPDFSQVKEIIIGSCQVIGPEVTDTISISSIRFVASNRILIIVLSSILSVLFLGILYLQLRKKKEQTSLNIAYTPLPVSDIANKDFQKIASFIAENYSNPELSLSDVQNGVGMNGKAISKLIKEHLQISFTDYLNQLRITEVKRLLKETKLPVSDIAYKVGYNNISHFNRVFKTITGTSPKVFRDEE